MSLFGRDSVADLVERRDVTFALLSDGSWKKRAVEEITIGSALSLESRRSFQCADIGQVIGGRVRSRHAREARLLLPVTTLPKRPVLGFDISAPDRTIAHLPPRGALAELEAQYVITLAHDAGIAVGPRLAALITSICEFPPGRWERWKRDAPLVDRVRSYVSEATGWAVSADLAGQWLATQEPAALALCGVIGRERDLASSAENPAVVAPLLARTLGIGPDDVLPMLSEYADFVARCAAAPDVQPFAPHEVLADYGRWWEVIVECTVPLDGPFIVRMSERRPLVVDGTGQAVIDVTTGDATSNHTVVRVVDADVEIRPRKVEAFAPDGTPASGHFDSIRITREEVAAYASEEDREYELTLRLDLALRPHVTLTNAVVAAVTIACIGIVLVRWRTLSEADLAVLVIPTTFATSLLVTRERTTLSAHLAARWRRFLLGLIVLLWTLVAALYLGDTSIGRTACAPRIVTPPVFGTPEATYRQPRSCDGEEHR